MLIGSLIAVQSHRDPLKSDALFGSLLVDESMPMYLLQGQVVSWEEYA